MVKFLPGGVGGGIASHVDGWRGWGLFLVGVVALGLTMLVADYE